MTRLLESAAFVNRFDVVIIADVGIGQITPAAQRNLVQFVEAGGGLVWGLVGKGTLPFQDSPAAVPMPLASILPVAYPDFGKPHPQAVVRPNTDKLFQGIQWEALKDKGARGTLARLAWERKVGKGMVLGLAGGFEKPLKYVGYAAFEPLPGGWDHFPALGTLWCRVLQHAAAGSPIRALSRADVDGRYPARSLDARLTVDAARPLDDIRAAVFSIVALQQLYNEDGGHGEDLFLALNPRDWFDRRSQEVLPNKIGKKSDKPAFFKEYNIRGIYMGDNSYGSYSQWNDAKYKEQIARAIAARKKWPDQIVFFQAGNEPPLDAGYVAFHRRFVGAVLAGAAELPGDRSQQGLQCSRRRSGRNAVLCRQVRQDHRRAELAHLCPAAQHGLGRGPLLERPGRRQDAQARPGTGDVHRERGLEHGRQPVQLSHGARAHLPARTANHRQFPILHGKTIRRGDVLLRRPAAGRRVLRQLQRLLGMAQPARADAASQADRGRRAGQLCAVSSISRDGKTVTALVYFGAPLWTEKSRLETAKVAVDVALPAGQWTLMRSRVTWKERKESAAGAMSGHAQVYLELAPYEAAALTWTKK